MPTPAVLVSPVAPGSDAGPLLVDVLRTNGWRVGGYALVALMNAATALTIPLVLGAAVDGALGRSTGSAALVLLAVLLAAATLAELIAELVEVSTSTTAGARLRRRLVVHLLAMDQRGQRRLPAGDVLSRLLESTAQAATLVPTTVGALVSLLISVGGVVALVLIDPWLGLVFGLGAPLVWWLAKGLVRTSGRLTVDYQQRQSEVASRLLDAVSGIRSIRASGTVELEVARVLAPLPSLRAAGTAFWRVQRDVGFQLGVLMPLLHVAVLATAGWGLWAGRISPGELIAVGGYLAFASGIFGQVHVAGAYGRIRGSAERVQELLDLPAADVGEQELPPGPGSVRLRGVSVRDGGAALLSDVDLVLPGGSLVAVVGASGSGKSTLAAVAGGLRRPDDGVVTIDGLDLRRASRAALAGAVTYAFDRPVLLGGTVGGALSYADHPVPPSAVAAGTRAACAEEFIARLPHRFDTALADLRVSGGEKQRIGLARAFARPARVTVLDDALSAVDPLTELSIARALAARAGTRLVVTHRRSTASRSDVVVWMRDGRVAGVGQHAELLDMPDYAAMFASSGGCS